MPCTSRQLMDLYRAMRDRFGPRHWWPTSDSVSAADHPLEICIGAILTQNTNWRNVEKAIANLVAAACVSLSALHTKRPEALARLIRPAGYFNVKTKRLKSFVAHVRQYCGDDIRAFWDRPVDVLRKDLLSIHGVGPETADSIILYAAGKPSFVVDAYTRRILSRHGLIDPDASYETVRTMFETLLPRDAALWNDYHAQLVAVGKDFCRPTPRCQDCPLDHFPHAAST